MTSAATPGPSRRTALVAGATGGIGEAVARRLAADGFRVLVAGRRVDRLERLAAEIGGVAFPFDMVDEGAVEGVAGLVAASAGGSGAGAPAGESGAGAPAGEPGATAPAAEGATRSLDVLVNAAGVFDLASVVETSGEVLRRNLDVNLVGAVNLTRALLPGMLAAGSGLVINVGSVAGWRAFPHNGAYSASKFGLRGFHEVLLEELRGTGVRACLVEPGAVDTAIWDPLDPDGSPELPGRGDMLRPDDVARAVGFVAGLPEGVAVPLLRIERG